MSDVWHVGLRLTLQRLWNNLKNLATNRSEERRVFEQEDDPMYQYRKFYPKRKTIVPCIKNQRLIPLPSQTPMNLLSLPDEMIASVLKYSKFETLTRLRKINVRINNIIVGYGITKAKVFILIAQPRMLRFKYNLVDLFEYKPSVTKIINGRIRCADVYLKLEEKLKNSYGLQTLKIKDIRIDSNWLNLIKSIEEKQKVDITIISCHFLVAFDEIKKVLEKFKSVEIKGSVNAKFDGNIVTVV